MEARNTVAGDYQVYLAINDIGHARTKAKSPQTNGICERFHETVLDEFYRVAFREKIYRNLESLQKDLDERLHYSIYERTPQGRMRCQAATRLEGILHAALAFIHSFSIKEGGKSNCRRALDMVVFPWVISSDFTLTTSCVARSANASTSAMNSDHTRLFGASRGLSIEPQCG